MFPLMCGGWVRRSAPCGPLIILILKCLMAQNRPNLCAGQSLTPMILCYHCAQSPVGETLQKRFAASLEKKLTRMKLCENVK